MRNNIHDSMSWWACFTQPRGNLSKSVNIVKSKPKKDEKAKKAKKKQAKASKKANRKKKK